jgi:leucyl aminopeptidase
MQVTASTRNPLSAECELLAVPLAELGPERQRLPSRVAAIDRGLGGCISAALERGDFKGRARQSLLLYPQEGSVSRVLLLGMGEESAIDSAALREAAGAAVKAGRKHRANRVGLLPMGGRRGRSAAAAQALAEGATLGSYRFDRYKGKGDEDENEATDPGLVVHVEKSQDLRATRAALARGCTLGDAQNLARDLSNEPPNVMTPAALAKAASKMARAAGLKVRVLERVELSKRKMGAMLAVAQGSHNAPRLIVLEHNPPPRAKKKGTKPRRKPTVCLVGKGVCFDSGGLSLKPATSMVKMKHDMSGGATVIGAMQAIAALKIPLHVVGIVGAVENMPSGHAYRVDDILTSASGKTIEVTNTDAEGRLVLADALHYAQEEFKPEALLDLATLTGACAIALGPWAAAVVSAHERLAEAVVKAGEATDERFWPLPLWDVHRDHMRSQIADVRQTGGRDAGTTTAGAFLAHFVDKDLPWAHLDIASVADTERTGSLQPRGATGFGVRTVLELLRGWKDVKLG